MLASDHPLPLPPKPEKENPIELFTKSGHLAKNKSLIKLPFASLRASCGLVCPNGKLTEVNMTMGSSNHPKTH